MDKIPARFAILLSVILRSVLASEGELQEICVTEKFNASCPADSVIVIQEARYGRMRLGRCVHTDFGYIGCHAIVLDVMDSKCSGRRSCSVTVPDPLLEDKRACNIEFKSYMEIRYTCVPVVSTNGRRCHGADTPTLRDGTGFLASTVTEDTGCGWDASPWRIEAQSGQKINLTLYDFAWSRTDSQGGDMCTQYAVISESGTGHKHNVCGQRDRQTAVYTSVTNSLDIRIMRQFHQETKAYFLLQYQVAGCQDPVLPKNAWLKREGDTATIGCDHCATTWQVQCHGNQWTGTVGNCTIEAYSSSLPSTHHRLLSLPMDVAIVIIAGVAFVIGAIIFVIGLYIIRRRHFSRPMGPPRTQIYRDDDPGKQVGLRSEEDWKAAYHLQGKPPGIYMQTSDTGSATENEYAYVWDTAPSPPGVSFIQSTEVAAGTDKRVNFRDALPLGSRQCTGADQRSPSNTNAHAGQYEKRLPTHSGLDSVYERGAKPHPQYFELDQFNTAMGSKD